MPTPPTVSPDPLDSSLRDDIARLPMLPSMLTQLALLDADDPSYFDEVLKLVQGDPGFAVRLLRLANSVASGSHNVASSINMALIRVGARAAVELMLAEKAVTLFPAREHWQRDLWAHSLLVAHYMRRLAPMVVDARLDSNEAYLAGLLHDIGRFLLYARMPDAFETLADAGWDMPSELIQAEWATCGCTHTQLAHDALLQWGLSPTLALAARDHHRTAAADDERQVGKLVALLRDVDWLAMIVARQGLPWLEQDPATCEALCNAHMRLRYRGDMVHRLSILRTATMEAARFLGALGLDSKAFTPSAPAELAPPPHIGVKLTT